VLHSDNNFDLFPYGLTTFGRAFDLREERMA
jgi:hypothetical protein